MPDIYRNVVEIANKKKMTISKLEDLEEISPGTISKWKKCNPRIDTLKAVADVLKVKVDKLLE